MYGCTSSRVESVVVRASCVMAICRHRHHTTMHRERETRGTARAPSLPATARPHNVSRPSAPVRESERAECVRVCVSVWMCVSALCMSHTDGACFSRCERETASRPRDTARSQRRHTTSAAAVGVVRRRTPRCPTQRSLSLPTRSHSLSRNRMCVV